MRWPGLRCLIRLVSIIYREMTYLSLRSEKHSWARDELVRKAKLGLLGYAFYSTAIALTTSVLSAAPLLVRGQDVALEGAVMASALIYTTLLLVFTLMMCVSSAWAMQECRLFEPLMSLPLRRRDIWAISALIASTDVAPMAIAPLIYGALMATALGSALAGAIGSLYGYVSMSLAMGGALTLSSLISRRVSGTSVKAKMARMLSTTAFIACLVMSLLASQLIDVLAPRVSEQVIKVSLPVQLTWLMYPFSVGEGMLMALKSESTTASISLILIYLALSIVFFERGLSRYWSNLASCSSRLGRPAEVRLRAPPGLDPSIGVLIKDLKMLYRDPRAYHLLIAPAIAHVALFTIALRIGGLPPYIVGLSYGLLGTAMGTASYQLMVAEEGTFWLLFSSGLSRRNLALGKALACFLTYVTCALPLNILLSCCLSEPYYAAYAASSALLGFSASAVCARYLAELVEPEDRILKLTMVDELLMASMLLALLAPYCLTALLAGPLAAFIVALAEAITCLIVAAW